MDPLTIDELRALPATTALMTAARALGISRTLAYGLARAGTFPCPVTRVGNRYRVHTASLLDLLGVQRIEKATMIAAQGEASRGSDAAEDGP